MVHIRWIQNLGFRLGLALMMVFPLLAGAVSPAFASEGNPGAVFTLTNAANGNEVLVYDRASDGTLTFQSAYATGGLGSGAGLGSQGALVLNQNQRWLVAVNAGSDDISIFRVEQDGLDLADVAPSGGDHPISVTVHGRLVYVLNDGGSGNISGFLIGLGGRLTPIPGSTQPLSNSGAGASPGPAQISFTPDGRALVVTEKNTNLIDVYSVKRGVASGPQAHPSAGATPFGFAISRKGFLIVSEAFGGQPDLSAVSSYSVSKEDLDLISPSVGTTQTAACWVVVTDNGKYAYTTNTGSGSISSYRISRHGSLSLLDPAAGLTGDGSRPIDMALSVNNRYLYALNAGTADIGAFRVKPNGGLEPIGNATVLAGSVGLAAK
jgi:6-phosphogluconolactonase (cycloisomerase 2 family)